MVGSVFGVSDPVFRWSPGSIARSASSRTVLLQYNHSTKLSDEGVADVNATLSLRRCLENVVLVTCCQSAHIHQELLLKADVAA